MFDGKAGGAHGGIGGRKGKGTSDTSSDSPQHPELAAEEGNAMAAARAAVDRERERQAQVVAELDSLRAMLEAERERHAAELRSLRSELQFALLTARQNSAASAEGTSLAHCEAAPANERVPRRGRLGPGPQTAQHRSRSLPPSLEGAGGRERKQVRDSVVVLGRDGLLLYWPSVCATYGELP